jgi:hypothetical protein
MAGLRARNGGTAGVVALALVLALGLGLRVDDAWRGRAPVYDAQAYARIARNLERGRGFTLGRAATQPASNYSPGLPLLVAAIYEIAGGVHERLARIVLALVGSLAVLFAYLIGRRLAGVGAGLLAALAVAIYPALLEYQGMFMSEPLAATLLSGAVLAMFWAADARAPAARAPRWLFPGLLLGALAMVRPEFLAVGVLLAIVVALLPRRWAENPRYDAGIGPSTRGLPEIGPSTRGFACAAVLLVGVVVVVLPWTVRNAVALDRFVPISTGGGQVLFAGTYLPSGGDPQRVGAEVVERNPRLFAPRDVRRLRLEQILARLAADRRPGVESDRALAEMGREQLWEDVSEKPLEYAGFVAAKVGDVWSHGPREVMRQPLWEALHWVLLALGLAGLALLLARRRWEAVVIAAIFLAITAICALLVASPRRTLVLLPLLAACAGAGALSLASRGRRIAWPV